MTKTTDEKVNTVLKHNTFWFQDRVFEEKYEAHITVLKETLLILRNQIQNQGLTKKLVEDLLSEKTNGLKVLLALTGLSNESFKRLVSFIRVVDDAELSKLSYRNQWLEEAELDKPDITEWSDSKIESKIRESVYFRKGIVNLFYEGSTIPLLSKTLPLFELKKLSFSKLNFDVEAMIDTLVRYKEKGSYSGQMKNNPEIVIGNLLDEMEISFETGDLDKLKEHAPTEKRTMDFIIPNQEHPQIVIESSYLTTTSSGQGDKAKTENHIRHLLKEHYSNARFWGFVDGIGWYVRKNDLRRMVKAFEDVFTMETMEEAELQRFSQSLITVLK
jgi:hypothetical protein